MVFTGQPGQVTGCAVAMARASPPCARHL